MINIGFGEGRKMIIFIGLWINQMQRIWLTIYRCACVCIYTVKCILHTNFFGSHSDSKSVSYDCLNFIKSPLSLLLFHAVHVNSALHEAIRACGFALGGKWGNLLLTIT